MTEMGENIFTADIKAPIPCIKQPTDLDGYIIVAGELLPGVEALSTIKNIPPRACAMIAAHTLECVLKTFLFYKERKKEIKKAGHNLMSLWNLAWKEDLGISEDPPDWVKILSDGHGPFFYFRYQEAGEKINEKKVIAHIGQTPQLIPMADELKKLFLKVENIVK
jgi:hypothetical protein